MIGTPLQLRTQALAPGALQLVVIASIIDDFAVRSWRSL